MSDTIVVTGATGTVGSEVVKQLSAKGATVRACCHTLSKGDMIKGPGVEVVGFDYDEPETVKAAFRDTERLFLMTPFVENWVEITARLVAEAKKAGVRHIVKLSNMELEADAEAILLPLIWHRQAEGIIEESGIPLTHVRPSVFMQNFVNLSGPTIKAQSAIYSSAGEAKVGYVDARDIAAVAAEALTGDGHEGKIYTTTGPEALSYDQVAEVLSEALGRRISHVHMSEEDERKGMEERSAPDWIIQTYVEGGRILREGRLSAVLPTVEEVTGKKPRSFEQFARDYAEAFG
ncbi:MAG: SDR family oxidoreductase [Thermoplasmata archaeon]